MTEDAETEKSGKNENTSQEDKEKASPEKLGITMDKRIDLAVAIAIVLLGMSIVITARDIREGMIPDTITSRGMPNIVGVFIIIGGIILMVMRLRTWSALPGHFVLEEGKADEEGHPASWVRAFSIVAASLVWEWLLKPLGYLFATPLFLGAVTLIMGERSWWKIVSYSIIYTFVTWYLFSQPLQVILPLGPLDHLARSWGLTP